MKDLKCPYCGSLIRIDENASSATCSFCDYAFAGFKEKKTEKTAVCPMCDNTRFINAKDGSITCVACGYKMIIK